ncbi:MAG: SIS domain-containing protein [Clostridia bacterium]
MNHMMREILSQPEIIEKCIIENRAIALEIAGVIKKRNIRHIWIAARGTSDHAAIYAKYMLEIHTGIPVGLAAPSVITIYHANLDFSDSLVIAISQSGKALDALEVLRQGKRTGALTLALTNDGESPLAREAGYHISCLAGEEVSVAATKTFTSTLINLALLTWAMTGKKDLMDEIASIPGIMETYLSRYEMPAGFIGRLKDMEECFVLSRGTGYPVALEGALKIQETCYVRAKGYAISDFYHGPLAMMEKGFPVLVIAPGSSIDRDIRAILDKLRDIGAKLIVFSDNIEFLELADMAFPMPEGLGYSSAPLIYTTAMQRFACMLSLEKGLDPDRPRNLQKVTLTK